MIMYKIIFTLIFKTADSDNGLLSANYANSGQAAVWPEPTLFSAPDLQKRVFRIILSYYYYFFVCFSVKTYVVIPREETILIPRL